jgi:hypothetical protein
VASGRKKKVETALIRTNNPKLLLAVDRAADVHGRSRNAELNLYLGIGVALSTYFAALETPADVPLRNEALEAAREDLRSLFRAGFGHEFPEELFNSFLQGLPRHGVQLDPDRN